MKKYITSTLLFLISLHLIYAQDSACYELYHLSKPLSNGNAGSLNIKCLYFENYWVKGKLLTSNNNVISSDCFFFNFDKMDHRLLITADFKKLYEIDRREFKAIIFYWHDSAFVFKHIYFINDKDLFQVMINEDSKYSLYKVVRTKLVKGNFGLTGFSSPSVSVFDRYEDLPEYYIFFPNKEYRSTYFLKKAAIERMFEFNPDSEKVNNYLNMAGNKSYTENDLVQLVLYLNKG